MRNSLFAIVILSLLFVMPSYVMASDWYIGGTLHKSDVRQWNQATYVNKLATAADMALGAKKVKIKVMRSGSVETLRPYAEQLVQCVNEAAAGKGYERTRISELAAGCMILMCWN